MTVLPEQTRWYLGVIDDLIAHLQRPPYAFMDLSEFKRTHRASIAQGNNIYWTEMLARVHLTAVTALKRSRKWVDGIETALESNNLLLFAAAIRGFIESAADATDGLLSTPAVLVEQYSKIRQALQG